MARPKRPRLVQFLPEVTFFKPQGVPVNQLEQVDLSVDELEALRLVDFNGLEQEKAADQMHISQSTLQRILASARKKIAQALVLGKAIKVKGGEVKMVNRPGGGRGRGGQGGPYRGGPGGICTCTNPDCEYEEEHQVGKPCYQQKCPQCGSAMIRKREE